jgi:hypothetical protein
MAVEVEPVRRLELGLSWRAIFVGLVVGLATQFILTLLGVAIGLSVLDVAGPGSNAKGVGIGAGIWTLVVPIISWYLGAYSASYASGVYDRGVGVLHGITQWGLGLVLVLFVFSSGVSGLISKTFGAVGTTAQTLSQSGLVQRSDVKKLQNSGVQEQAQQKLSNLGPEDAQAAASGAAKGAWGAFVAAILSFAAACLGGAAGTRTLMHRSELPGGRRRDREPLQPLTPRTNP